MTIVVITLGIHGRIEVEREDEVPDDLLNDGQRVDLGPLKQVIRRAQGYVSCWVKCPTEACNTSSRTWTNPCRGLQRDGIGLGGFSAVIGPWVPVTWRRR